MSRAVGPILGAAVAAALAFGYRLTQQPAPQQNPVRSLQATTITAAAKSTGTDMPAARNAAGDDLWRQSLRASGPDGTPIKAHVAITRAGDVPERTEFDLSEGGGRYRLSYTAPQSARGRVVVSDGKTLWQYEPTRRTVLRRSLSVNTLGSPLKEAALPAGVLAEVEEATVSAEGRPAQTLIFRDAKGALLSRRWVDTATKRSLRSETYDPQTGKRLILVALTQIQPLPNPAPALFQPDFPGSPRLLKADATHSPDLIKAARRTGLPVTAGTYRLQSVLRSHSPVAALTALSSADHLIYSNGINAVSVFAAKKASEPITLRPGSDWQAVPLSSETPDFIHTDGQGRTALAWIRDGKRLVAVSRLPQSELLTMARSLTSR